MSSTTSPITQASATSPDPWRSSVPFLACHAVPLGALWTGVTARSLVLLVVLYVTRMFFITAGYHRYFAHRSYRMARVPQFLVAFGGLTAVQKGPLWWAGNHRDHHRYTDGERDPHTPKKGFWWSHIGWVLSSDYGRSDHDKIRDFARFPELRFLDRHDWLGPWAVGVASYIVAGWPGVVVGFFGSTVLLWHATFSVNSLAHMIGRRRYDTPDTSRNLWPLALLTFGEGWHNNHHHYPASARQGFTWWQLDVSYFALRALACVRLVRGLRQPTSAALANRRPRRWPTDVRGAGQPPDRPQRRGRSRSHSTAPDTGRALTATRSNRLGRRAHLASEPNTRGTQSIPASPGLSWSLPRWFGPSSHSAS